MKFKTTQKEVMHNYNTVIKVGYCELQTLLHYENPVAYNAGRNGWNCDIYEIYPYKGVVIVTGYNPFGNVSASYETCKKYEKKAGKIVYDYSIDYEKRKEKVHKLITDFIKENLENK